MKYWFDWSNRWKLWLSQKDVRSQAKRKCLLIKRGNICHFGRYVIAHHSTISNLVQRVYGMIECHNEQHYTIVSFYIIIAPGGVSGLIVWNAMAYFHNTSLGYSYLHFSWGSLYPEPGAWFWFLALFSGASVFNNRHDRYVTWHTHKRRFHQISSQCINRSLGLIQLNIYIFISLTKIWTNQLKHAGIFFLLLLF